MRVLVATAVPAERDAVARAFQGTARLLERVPGVGAEPGWVARPGADGAPPAPTRAAPGGTHARSLSGVAGVDVDLLAVGVGPALAAAATATALASAALSGVPYSLVVSAGIAGGFVPHAPVGSLVVADEIVVADLGAETADGFLPVTELGFGVVSHRPPDALVREAVAATGARSGAVLTVSTVTGSAERAATLRHRHPTALAEAMEGFGVAEAAVLHGVPVMEVRAVSNPVGPRDRAAWRIGDALDALTEGFGKLGPVLTGWNPHDS
ncbi:futalosine hydrolase [Streptomyces sp. S.PB5]|uniref:futalosine hydrolase n=1 Tax=Streptomyces sp. S.PB5 TaxID=3020844 RepID=UPI0025B15187|nr:futalosine hydrolase [Streptomyces sp. S.PB5]MDN3023383.1 futalosine hydrolase [Streptomyces sp. S.PB5]